MFRTLVAMRVVREMLGPCRVSKSLHNNRKRLGVRHVNALLAEHAQIVNSRLPNCRQIRTKIFCRYSHTQTSHITKSTSDICTIGA